MKKKLVFIAFAIMVSSSSVLAADLASLAKGVYAKAGGNKTESQWTRYFAKPKWQKRLGIDGLSQGDRDSLLSYMNTRSADKDSATVPQ